jgi:hypothetical protein
MSSDDGKALLVAHLADQGHATQASEWKRRSKTKNAQGEVVRTFEHVQAGHWTVTERQGESVIERVAPVSEALPPTSSRFTPADVAGARQVALQLARLLADDDADEDPYDQVWESDQYARYRHALPAVLGFLFPAGVYGNARKSPTDLNQPAGRACFILLEQIHTPPDFELNISSLMQDQMPTWVTEQVDEYHWEIQKDCTRTILEVAQELVGMGFRYLPQDCMFGPVLGPVLEAATIAKASPASLQTVKKPQRRP